jgi:hypothetical protein
MPGQSIPLNKGWVLLDASFKTGILPYDEYFSFASISVIRNGNFGLF